MYHSYPQFTMRRAFTLIEMMVVMTIGTVAIGAAVSALLTLMRTERVGRDRIPQVSMMAQLAEQYRSDAHAAVRTSPEDTPSRQQFIFADGRSVTYRVPSNEVERLEQTNDKKIRHESYVLPEGMAASFTIDLKSSPTQVGLLLENVPESLPKRSWCIMAMIGRDHRFESTESEGK